MVDWFEEKDFFEEKKKKEKREREKKKEKRKVLVFYLCNWIDEQNLLD